VAFGAAATATFSQYIAGSESEMKTIQGDGHANTLAIKMINYGGGVPAVDLSDLAFKSWSANDKVAIIGTKSADAIAGSTMGDVINGGRGSDGLQGNEGGDTFVFALQQSRGVDRIADFSRAEGDKIQLIGLTGTKMKAGTLKKSAFEIGIEADSRKDRIIYDDDSGVLRYDADGSGKQKAKIVAVLEDAAILKAGDILLI
jgi:Ca2+-binding RTX toxin-like protein